MSPRCVCGKVPTRVLKEIVPGQAKNWIRLVSRNIKRQKMATAQTKLSRKEGEENGGYVFLLYFEERNCWLYIIKGWSKRDIKEGICYVQVRNF